jgi:hypothetical protein
MAASPYMDSMGLAPESVNLVTNAADSLASIGREARLCLKREGEAPAELRENNQIRLSGSFALPPWLAICVLIQSLGCVAISAVAAR